ncbi:unnamed protein product [Camellia sinensis]
MYLCVEVILILYLSFQSISAFSLSHSLSLSSLNLKLSPFSLLSSLYTLFHIRSQLVAFSDAVASSDATASFDATTTVLPLLSSLSRSSPLHIYSRENEIDRAWWSPPRTISNLDLVFFSVCVCVSMCVYIYIFVCFTTSTSDCVVIF